MQPSFDGGDHITVQAKWSLLRFIVLIAESPLQPHLCRGIQFADFSLYTGVGCSSLIVSHGPERITRLSVGCDTDTSLSLSLTLWTASTPTSPRTPDQLTAYAVSR
ncbi:hypothetical protein TcWFU_006490 [Taenia crassiceps]|uniref:Uncharacterized protein n=1 Tax=Taenia crassiceps TaxID=6207 RepID=A0ABR4QBV3_9CEST